MEQLLENIDWFEWNGVRCTQYGMHVLAQPPRQTPSERTENVIVPGRSGSLTLLEGEHVYEDMVLSCTCVIDDPYGMLPDNPKLPGPAYPNNTNRLDFLSFWLRGQGYVSFATPDRTAMINNKITATGFYKAQLVNQISFDKIVRGHPHINFQLQFKCHPFFYLASGEVITQYTASGTTNNIQLTNEGTAPSEPLFEVRGTATITPENPITLTNLSDPDNELIIKDLKSTEYIKLDCESKLAYRGSPLTPADPPVLMNQKAGGNWMQIPTGTTILRITGALTNIKITPRWRKL